MSNTPIVYVVDDDVGVRKALSFLLVSAGLNVRLYESAKAFLEEVNDPGRCCIVTDVRMPGIDGLEFIRRLAKPRNQCPVDRHDRSCRHSPGRGSHESRRHRFS